MYFKQQKWHLALASTALVLLAVLAIPQQDVAAQGLRVEPLKYEEQLELGDEKTGYVDVSNPGDTDVTVTTEVQAFRQINIDGDLEFYDDEQIQAGIDIDVDEFELGPREAARIFFEIDSNALPEGGVYAALLFGTEAFGGGDDVGAIDTTTRVGTLLLLENGDEGVRDGSFTELDIGFWQFGSGISGRTEFTAAEGEMAVAFEPELATEIPIAGAEAMESGLVFAGNSRHFDIARDGNYLGVFPVSVTDEVTGESERQWVFAVTGVWQIIAPIFLLALVLSVILQFYFQRRSRT